MWILMVCSILGARHNNIAINYVSLGNKVMFKIKSTNKSRPNKNLNTECRYLSLLEFLASHEDKRLHWTAQNNYYTGNLRYLSKGLLVLLAFQCSHIPNILCYLMLFFFSENGFCQFWRKLSLKICSVFLLFLKCSCMEK